MFRRNYPASTLPLAKYFKINCKPAGTPGHTDINNRHSISNRLCLLPMAAEFKTHRFPHCDPPASACYPK